MSIHERTILSIVEIVEGRSLVERPAPGKAPTAFRIWAYGPNIVDGKTVVFSERSADALLAEQTSRGRLYSFDFDHRSLMQDVTPSAGEAAGWHVLEVREHEGKPELWAASCEWTTEAREGLEAEPPKWRYFSPCYETDSETREVVSYVNCALTNNPRTHGIPALASAVSGGPLNATRLFELHRDADETGVSGTGIVAEGVVFGDGTVALRWKTDMASTTLFDDVEQMLQVHGHGGATRLVYRQPSIANAVDASTTSVAAEARPDRLQVARLALRELLLRLQRR